MAALPQPHFGCIPPHQEFSRRGSILIVAMCFAALIAISLTSYIKLALNSMKLADRSYYQNSAMNLAEVGIEEAMYCFNRLDEVPKTSPEDAWAPYGWTVAGDNSATRTISNLPVGPGITALVKIHCSLYKPTLPTDRPVVVSKAILTFPNAPSMSKYVEVTIRKRSLFPRGMVVRQTIDANGGSLSLDSWDSEDDGDPATPNVVYSTSTRKANATLATMNTTDNAIDIGNGAIYGFIATPGGVVRSGATAILTGDFTSTEFDTQRISNDFEVTSFPPISLPAPSYVNYITSSIGATTLPTGSDTAASDGCYYYNFSPGAGISLNGGTFQISGKVVVMLINHSGVGALIAGGSSGVNIATGASLTIYTNGNISVTGGGGLSNGNSEPSSCVFFGTNSTPGSQTITLSGNGHTSVSLFAPNAVITMSGGGSGGDFYGAIVGYSVRMNGNTRFHYDEALGRLYTGKPFGIAKWRELQTLEERDVYTAKLNF
jgi:hypothetical protein